MVTKTARSRVSSHMWTKEEIRKVATLWESSTISELEDELGLVKNRIMYIVKKMRDAGFDLPRKKKHGYIDSLLKEVKLELR